VKLYLVDGTFELFRCFHGAPRAQLEDGREVGAARGFLFTLIKLLRNPELTHVAVAFDAMAGGSRTARASRTLDEGSLLRSQYLPATDVVRALGVTLWPMRRYQADEALATAAERFAADERLEQIVLCTTDKDLLQCVRGRRVVHFDRIRDRLTDEEGIRARFGLAPAQLPELFALIGDPSDGLPGLPHWGPKSAAAVLRRYGRIEDVPQAAADWDVTVRGAERLSGILAARRREVILMRDLCRLRTNVPLSDSLSDLEWSGADRGALTELVAWLGGAEMLEKVRRWRDQAKE
jgi:5'-3' exonuclease